MANVIKHKRGSGSDPGASDLILGELAIRTDTGKLFTKMDSGAIAEIAGGGSDIAINTLSSSSGTGGGSATFNGSAYRFTLSAPPNVSAAQLLVSINGVIQKPVAGTGQPSEGFSVDGTDIILGDAPATGSDFFILTFKSLGVSEPADNSVTSAKIVDGAIVNADINASAAIAGTKISPNFGSQNILTTGKLGVGTTSLNSVFPVTIQAQYPGIQFLDAQGTDSFGINADGGVLKLQVGVGGSGPTQVLQIATASTTITNNLNVSAGIDVTGAITGTGDMTIDTNTLHVDSSNNRVGIGTTSPETLLDVARSSTTGYSTSSTTNDSTFRILNSGAAGHATMQFQCLSSGTANTGQATISAFSEAASSKSTSLTFGTRDNSGNAPTERMRIDSSGRLLIGTTTVGAKDAASPLQIQTADSGAFAITIKNRASNNDYSFIGFTDDDASEDLAQIGVQRTAANTGDIFFYTNGGSSGSNERMRIDSSGTIFSFSSNDTTPNIKWRSDDTNWFGSLNQSVEGATISTFLSTGGDWSANGTTYSATKAIANFETRAIVLHPQFNNGAGKVAFLQKAPGSSTTDGTVTEILKIDNDGIKFGTDTAAANALDDYEEGTWTPTFNNAGGFGTNNTVGKYTKIGRVVHWVCQVAVVRDTSSSSGTFTISGLPFTALNGATGGHGYAGCMGALFNWNIPDTAYQIGIRVPDNNSFIQFFANFDNAADSQLTSPFDANKTIFGSLAGTYIT
jgi:hypothetical protein